MTKGRVFGGLCLIAGVVMTAMGLTNSRVTELLYGSWALALLGLIVLALSRPAPPRVEPTPFGDPTLEKLGRAHAFSKEMLDANRAGTIHPEQMATGVSRGRRDVNFGRVMLGIGGVILAAGLALPWFPRALIDQDFHFAVPEELGVALIVGLLVGGVLGAIPLALGFAAWSYGRRVLKGYGDGVAGVVEGPLQMLVIRHRHTSRTYYYVFGEQRFWVINGGWDASESGARYRMYYAPLCHHVLSLEPI